MTKNFKITAVIAVVAVVGAIVAVYYLSNPSTPRSGNVAPVEGSVSQAELDRATVSLKSTLGIADRLSGTSTAAFDWQAEPTYGHYANFGVVQNVNEVKSVGLVDEMAITFQGKTNNDNAEVDPKTGQVVAFHRETNYGGSTKTSAELEIEVRAFLNEVYPDWKEVEPTLTFDNNSKTGRPEGSNIFFTWNDMNYAKQLPKGAEAERAPFIQVGITSSGFIFGYNNTVDLYRNALKEFSVTQ